METSQTALEHLGDQQTEKRKQSIASLIPCKFLSDISLPVRSNLAIHLCKIPSRYPINFKRILNHFMFWLNLKRDEFNNRETSHFSFNELFTRIKNFTTLSLVLFHRRKKSLSYLFLSRGLDYLPLCNYYLFLFLFSTFFFHSKNLDLHCAKICLTAKMILRKQTGLNNKHNFIARNSQTLLKALC